MKVKGKEEVEDEEDKKEAKDKQGPRGSIRCDYFVVTIYTCCHHFNTHFLSNE